MDRDPLFIPLWHAADASATIEFDGTVLHVAPHQSVAAALLACGVRIFRATPVGAAPRAPYCMMGACFDCLLEIDGCANQRACMTPVRSGLVIRTPHGARRVHGGEAGGDAP